MLKNLSLESNKSHKPNNKEKNQTLCETSKFLTWTYYILCTRDMRHYAKSDSANSVGHSVLVISIEQ